MRYLSFLSLLLLSVSCGLTDLTEGYSPPAQPTLDGRALLEKAALAHGAEQWKKVAVYQVLLEDEFYGFVGKNGNPFPNNLAQLQLEYIPGTFTGRATFLEGKWADRVWGIHQWRTYSQKSAEAPLQIKQDKDILFWIPTYQYFLEFPARILEATYFAYLGERPVDGINHHVVLASWNRGEPQKDVDQYLIYIHPETHRIGRMEYTVREIYGFLSGGITFKEYWEKEGILLPKEMPVESNLVKDGLLHTMRITDVTFNHLEPAGLVPEDLDKLAPGTKPE